MGPNEEIRLLRCVLEGDIGARVPFSLSFLPDCYEVTR